MDQETKIKLKKIEEKTSLKAMYFKSIFISEIYVCFVFFSNLYWFFTLVMSRF